MHVEKSGPLKIVFSTVSDLWYIVTLIYFRIKSTVNLCLQNDEY